MRPLSLFCAAACAALFGCAVPRAVLVDEDLRVRDSPVLKGEARAPSAARRRAAVRAMGRVQSPAYAEALKARLSDRSRDVRAEAAFALGQLGLAAGDDSRGSAVEKKLQAGLAAALLPSARSGPLAVRLAAVEALGKTGPEAEEPLRALLRDPDPGLRGEAALGLFRLRFLKRVPAYSSAAARGLIVAMSDPAGEVRWKAAYAFSRFPQPEASTLLAQAVDGDPEPWARFFAARALGQLKSEAPWEELVRALRNAEPLMRGEAVRALGAAKRASYFPDSIYKDDSSHVRSAVADALAETGDPKLAYRLDDVDAESSPLARAAVDLAEPKLRPSRARVVLAHERESPDWWVRSRAVLATAELPGTAPDLIRALADPDARVAAAAVEGLAKASPDAFERYALGATRDARLTVEVLGAILEGASKSGNRRLLPALDAAAASPLAERYIELRDDIRSAQWAVLHGTAPYETPPAPAPLPEQVSPYVGKAPIGKPRVRLETQRGPIVIELEPAEAPVHAAAFLDRVAKGLYEGLTFHRVVPGFVVQGGDPRGSGWGDASFALRDEINPLRFMPGVVGMPKAGKDTGDGQLFIALVPTPHLDGRYTAFGRVVVGLDVAGKLEPGDRILGARIEKE